MYRKLPGDIRDEKKHEVSIMATSEERARFAAKHIGYRIAEATRFQWHFDQNTDEAILVLNPEV
jgi:hypothetical protein